MNGDIRYEIRCGFCASWLGGDSVDEAREKLLAHDEDHPRCARSLCRERITSAGATHCDDHWGESGEQEQALQ